LAYHDRSDGGLFSALCEMAFAGRTGVSIELPEVPGGKTVAEFLFNEELGAVLQVRTADVAAVRQAFGPLQRHVHAIGTLNDDDVIRVRAGGKSLFDEKRVDLRRAWSETSHHLQRLRDNSECAAEERDRNLDRDDPGLHAKLEFDPAEDVA